jgi:hypothetical protein
VDQLLGHTLSEIDLSILNDGQVIIPASDNSSRDDQRIRVFRLNRVLPAGGLPGSRWEARIRNSLEPIAVF